MKTKFPILLSLNFFFLFTTISILSLSAKDKDSYKIISGIVYDKKSKKEISNAVLSAKKTNISTVTNTDGFFTLKINDTLDIEQIEVSHLGYRNQLIDFYRENQQDIKIYLSPSVTALSEVIVEARTPLDIVKEAIRRIGVNNSENSNLLRGFYRETAQKRNTYITISEAIVDMYKTPYTRDVHEDGIQVLKGRTLLSPKLSDTIVVKAQGGPNVAKYLDVVKNRDLMLDLETIEHYKFKIDGYTTINEEVNYVISFEPRVSVPYALYYGKLYIVLENLNISRAELNLMVDDKDKAARTVLVKKPAKMRFQVNSLSSVITYKQQDGKSYLSYINNEIKFKCNWKKLFYIFAPTYTVTSEIVVTDRVEDNVKRIPNKDVFSPRQTLPDKIENFYDPDFWQAYNIIEPTESLESAVNKLKKSNH